MKSEIDAWFRTELGTLLTLLLMYDPLDANGYIKSNDTQMGQ
jgi:hypothetical protein